MLEWIRTTIYGDKKKDNDVPKSMPKAPANAAEEAPVLPKTPIVPTTPMPPPQSTPSGGDETKSKHSQMEDDHDEDEDEDDGGNGGGEEKKEGFSFEFKVATIWSIKKETFLKVSNKQLCAPAINTTCMPSFEYSFGIHVHDGDVAIFHPVSFFFPATKVKELTLTIASAGFKGDLTTPPDVPKGHWFEHTPNQVNILNNKGNYPYAVVLKRDDILNPDKKFFVNDILTLEFRGIIERIQKPKFEELDSLLWEANAFKDFTLIVEGKEIKAHKLVLHTLSPFFAKIIDSNINQFEYCYGFTSFCYDEPMLDCLRFASIYDMPSIRDRIGHDLRKEIRTKNVCKLANKSIEFKCPILKGYCINFILKSRAAGVPLHRESKLKPEFIEDLKKADSVHTVTSYIHGLDSLLWKANAFKDFTLIVEGKEIKAHKLVLHQLSPFFAKMIASNINQFEIKDFDYDDIHTFIGYCYNAIYYHHVDSMLDCLRFANNYDMPSIIDRIGHDLRKEIRTKNVCKLANKSIELKCPILKGYCINFILKSRAAGVQIDGESELNPEIIEDLKKADSVHTVTS